MNLRNRKPSERSDRVVCINRLANDFAIVRNHRIASQDHVVLILCLSEQLSVSVGSCSFRLSSLVVIREWNTVDSRVQHVHYIVLSVNINASFAFKKSYHWDICPTCIPLPLIVSASRLRKYLQLMWFSFHHFRC